MLVEIINIVQVFNPALDVTVVQRSACRNGKKSGKPRKSPGFPGIFGHCPHCHWTLETLQEIVVAVIALAGPPYCCSAGLTLATVVGEAHCCSVVTVKHYQADTVQSAPNVKQL